MAQKVRPPSAASGHYDWNEMYLVWQSQILQIEKEADMMSMTDTTTRSVGHSTVKGIGSSSGKVIMRAGQIAIRAGARVAVEMRLRRANSSLQLPAREIPRAVLEDILEYQRAGLYSKAVRSQAWRILLHLMIRDDFSDMSTVLARILENWPTCEIALLLKHMLTCMLCDWAFHPGYRNQQDGYLFASNATTLSKNLLRLTAILLRQDSLTVHQVVSTAHFALLLDRASRTMVLHPDSSLTASLLPYGEWIMEAVSLYLETLGAQTPPLSNHRSKTDKPNSIGYSPYTQDRQQQADASLNVFLMIYYLTAEESDRNTRWQRVGAVMLWDAKHSDEVISVLCQAIRSEPSFWKIAQMVRNLFSPILNLTNLLNTATSGPLSSEPCDLVLPGHAVCAQTIHHIIVTFPGFLEDILPIGEIEHHIFNLQKLLVICYLRYPRVYISHATLSEPSAPLDMMDHFLLSVLGIINDISGSKDHSPSVPLRLPPKLISSVCLCSDTYEGDHIPSVISFTAELLSFCQAVKNVLPANSPSTEAPPSVPLFHAISFNDGRMNISDAIKSYLRWSTIEFRFCLREVGTITDDLLSMALPFLRMLEQLRTGTPRLSTIVDKTLPSPFDSEWKLLQQLLEVEISLSGLILRIAGESLNPAQLGDRYSAIKKNLDISARDATLFSLLAQPVVPASAVPLFQLFTQGDGLEELNIVAFYKDLIRRICNKPNMCGVIRNHMSTAEVYMGHQAKLGDENPIYQLLTLTTGVINLNTVQLLVDDQFYRWFQLILSGVYSQLSLSNEKGEITEALTRHDYRARREACDKLVRHLRLFENNRALSPRSRQPLRLINQTFQRHSNRLYT